MPLTFTPYQEQEYLRNSGYDPESNYIEPTTGQILTKAKVQPTPSTQETVVQQPIVQAKPEPTSALAAGGRSFIRGLIPSGVGAGVGIGAAALAPATGGTSLLAIPLALGAGFAGSALAEKGQEMLMPESWKAKLAQDAQEQQVATQIGGIASAAPFFGASLPNVLRSGKTALSLGKNLIAGGEASMPVPGRDIANLVNVGLGGAIGAGSDVGMDLANNQPIDPRKALISAAGGMLMNNPTKLLGKLTRGLAQPNTGATPNLEEMGRNLAREGESMQGEATTKYNNAVKAKYLEEEPRGLRSALIRSEQQGGTPQELAQRNFDISETPEGYATKEGVRPRTFFSETKTDSKSGKESYAIPFKNISRQDKELFPSLIDEKGRLREGITEDIFRRRLDERVHGEAFNEYRNALEEARATNEAVNRQQAEQQKQENDANFVKGLGQVTKVGVEKRRNEQGQSFVTLPKDKAVTKNINYEHWKKEFAKFKESGNPADERAAKYFEEEGFKDRYATEEATKQAQPFTATKDINPSKTSFTEKNPEQEIPRKEFRAYQGEEAGLKSTTKLQEDLKKNDISSMPTTGLFKFVQQHLGPLRNIEVQSDGSLVDKRTGKPAKGVAILKEGIKERIAKINPFKATVDTLGHEPMHWFLHDLENSPHVGDKKLVERFYESVRNSEDFKRINNERAARGETPIDANEIGTEGAGVEFARRVLNPDNMQGTLKRSWQDFLSRVRVKWGKASTSDFESLLNQRLFHDPSYFERFVKREDLSAHINQEQEKEVIKNENEPKSEPSSNEVSGIKEGGLQQNTKEQVSSSGKEGGDRPSGKELISKEGTIATSSEGKLTNDQVTNNQQKTSDNTTGKNIDESNLPSKDNLWEKPQTQVARYSTEEQGLAHEAKDAVDYVPREIWNQGSGGYTQYTKEFDQKYSINAKDKQFKEDYKDFEAGLDFKGLSKLAKDLKLKTDISHLSERLGALQQEIRNNPNSETVLDFKRDYPDSYDFIAKDYAMMDYKEKFSQAFQEDLNDIDFSQTHDLEDFRNTDGVPDAKLIVNNWRKYRSVVFEQNPKLGYAIDILNDYQGPSDSPYKTFKYSTEEQGLVNEHGDAISDEADKRLTELAKKRDEEYSNVRNAQSRLLESFKSVLEKRDIFRDIEVKPKIPGGYLGLYDPSIDKAISNPEQVETALHESLHRLFEHSKLGKKRPNSLLPELDSELKTILNHAWDNHILNDTQLRDLATALKEEGYNNHNKSLNLIADEFTMADKYPEKIDLGNRVVPNLWNAKDQYISAIDEAISQYADGKGNEARNSVFRKSIEKIFGKDFAEFFDVKGESRNEKYFPKYENPSQQRIATLNEQIAKAQEVKKHIYNQFEQGILKQADFDNRDGNISRTISKLIKDRDKLRGEPGYYYSTNEQGLQPDEILNNLKSTAEAPEFQKANTFKRGLKELVTSRLPVFGSDISKLEARSGREGKLLGPALRENFANELAMEGRYLNPSNDIINKLSDKQLDNMYSVMLAEKRNQKAMPELLEDSATSDAYTKMRALIRQKQQDQIDAGQPVQDLSPEGEGEFRLPKINPFYIPEIVGGKQLDILLNAQGSQAFNNLKKDFISFQSKAYDVTTNKANEMFDDLIASYGGPVKGDTTHFGAVRRSEGVGLPDSWLERDLATAMRRYWRRVSKDRAFYDSIERDPNLLYLLGRKKDAWGRTVKPTEEGLTPLAGNETLGNIMDIIQGRSIKANPVLDATSRIASNLVLGPVTGITDLINAAPILSKFIPSPAHIPGYLKAVFNMRQGIKDAVATGRIKENTTAIGDITYPRGDFVEKLRDIGNMVSKVNTREYLERYSRGLSQALSDYLINVHKGLAETGNKNSEKLLSGLANGKDYSKLDNRELASRLLEFGQGTYDPRGLPSWAIDSQIAPLFRLAKWNIEQLNTLHKHALLPAAQFFKTGGKEGAIAPLLMTLAGGTIGGYMAKEVRERLNNKKQAIPEWAEILNSSRGLKGNIPAAAYNAAAAISYSGIAGLLGDGIKAGFDVAFKNTPQGFNYPLIELVGDTSVKIAQAVDAIAEGENPLNVVPSLMSDLTSQHIQLGRMVKNRFIDKQQREDTESRRNLRTYKMVEGEDYAPQGIQSAAENPYVDLQAKSFKRRGINELPEASVEAGELTKKALEGKNPETIKKKLLGLKRNNFQTIPSPNSSPSEFVKYTDYNTKVRGQGDTNKRVGRFIEQSQANKLKSKFIPSVH